MHEAILAVSFWLALAMPMLASGQILQSNSSVPAEFERMHSSLTVRADEMLSAPVVAGKAAPEFRQQYKAEGPAAVSRAVQRMKELMPVIEPILRQEGVPPELSAVILVESGGVPTALSSKGARGLWQFMPDTARRYGLVVSEQRDDRLNPEKSTRAAARYLRDLRAQFGSWELAFAAYNAGEQTVLRALSRSARGGFLAAKSYLPNETQSYVPAVNAAMQFLNRPQSVNQGASRALVLYAETGFE